MNETHIQRLIPYLEGFITEQRKTRLQQVLSQRSGHMRIVLENVFQAHNTSAVLRSCDCFGIQHVHFIENNNHLKISDDVALGSSNWLSIHRHNKAENNTHEAITTLKKEGFKIVATSPHKDDFTLHELPVDHKFALVFGTELQGISSEVIEAADAFVKIPMYGFTESFNISVSAAICMYELSRRIRETVPDHLLDEKEKNLVYFEWLKNTVQKSDALIEDFISKQK